MVILNSIEDLNLVDYTEPFFGRNILHFWVYNGHADLVEKILKIEPQLVEMVDDDKNTAFHLLWMNPVSWTSDLVFMYNALKLHKCDRKAQNKDHKTGMDILQFRIKTDNPYDWSLPATKGFLDSITSQKRKSLISTKSCPIDKKRFSGVSVALFKKY